MNDKETTLVEPEVLWEKGPVRFRADGEWQRWVESNFDSKYHRGTWVKANDLSETAIGFVLQELARRLLVEREEQEKLDDHNDSLEEGIEPFYVALKEVNEHRRRLNHHQTRLNIQTRRLEELDKNLAREIEQRALETKEQRRNCATYERVQADLIATVEGLKAALSLSSPAAAPEAPPADKLSSDAVVLAPIDTPALSWTKENRMIDPDGRVALDLGDYDNLRPEEHAWLSRLTDLWSAWGDGGYLRERLEGVDLTEIPSHRVFGFINWFNQLRSELLAKPWKEEA